MNENAATKLRIHAFLAGTILGAAVSPFAWLALEMPSWKAGAAVTTMLAVVSGLVSMFACPKKAERLLGLVLDWFPW